jgi:hypothetical protein
VTSGISSTPDGYAAAGSIFTPRLKRRASMIEQTVRPIAFALVERLRVSPNVSEPVIKRVVLSRYLFELALHNVRVQQETGDAACVNLLQDAVEVFFVAALDHLNVALKPKTDFFDIFGSRAPYYARDKDYIKKNVKDHFGYIVLDHAQVDRNLTREGIDHTAFWNVWPLTPQVYRHK